MSAQNERPPSGWRAQAACLDEDPELFFPLGITGPALEQAERATQVCARCPVTAICLGYALTTQQPYGVWGGLGENERHNLRRTRARRAAANPADSDGGEAAP